MAQLLEKNETESTKRTLEILESIQQNPIPLDQRLTVYRSRLEEIAKDLNQTSEQVLIMAESNSIPFAIASEVIELALLIKRHTTA